MHVCMLKCASLLFFYQVKKAQYNYLNSLDYGKQTKVK